jgi:adenine deaminase
MKTLKSRANMIIQGNLVDIENRKIYPAEIIVENGKIVAPSIPQGQNDHSQQPPQSREGEVSATQPLPDQDANSNQVSSKSGESAVDNPPLGGRGAGPLPFILPGFIDAHVHIESSMLIPSEFARLAVVHGTVATVSDPHEIANVCGMAGVEYMIKNGKTVPFKFYFGAPSCVPATTFETAGRSIDVNDINDLLRRDEIKYLSEMMNFPGVLSGDDEVMRKIASAKKMNKPVDGHAPGLRGVDAKKYIYAGITTDHECFTREEALDKLQHGMKIIIREGSAAKNFEALIELLHDYPDHIMFCSDDKHPDSLVDGHINQLCARAVAKGIDVFHVLKAACVNPVKHYKLDVGLLKVGDTADFIVVKDLKTFEVLQTFINGELVAGNGQSAIGNRQSATAKVINNFNCTKKKVEDFVVPFTTPHSPLAVIEALDGQLITNKILVEPKIENGKIITDIENDILKIVIVNRYRDAPIAKAFIKNFGLKKGAIASSVAHDSHNIVAVGVDDESLCDAVNLVIEEKGGISIAGISLTPNPSPRGEGNSTQPLLVNPTAINNESLKSGELCGSEALPPGGFGWALPLPVAGLMSTEDGYAVAEKYKAIDKAAKNLGSTLSSPFMTLSFMALLVIPHLKLSDKGLFDGDSFELIKI